MTPPYTGPRPESTGFGVLFGVVVRGGIDPYLDVTSALAGGLPADMGTTGTPAGGCMTVGLLSELKDARGAMTLTIKIQSPEVPAELIGVFETVTRIAFRGYEILRNSAGIPSVDVTAVLADDFVGTVNGYLEHAYDTARIGGGEAVGKTIALVPDQSQAAVVLDGTLWRAVGDATAQAFRIRLLAHELAHPVINRARHAAGMVGITSTPAPDEVLRDAAFGLADEYRANRMAETVVGELVSAEVDGNTVSYRSWWHVGGGYVDSLERILDTAHEDWPATVDHFIDGAITATQMWMQMTAAVNGTLVQLMHAQSLGDAPGVKIGDVLALPALADLPANRRYLADTVPPFLDVLRSIPDVATVAETRANEERIAQVGADMYREILRRVGVTTSVAATGETRIEASRAS